MLSAPHLQTAKAFLASIVVGSVLAGVSLAGDLGKTLFLEKCATCHGDAGEGVDDYTTPLVGDLPVRELTRVIEQTMPEDDPGDCVGEEAETIARYVYEAFYSPIAQTRRRPPQREFSRLTVRQYQQSLADISAELRGLGRWDERRGLKARFRAQVNVGSVEKPRTVILPRLDFVLTELVELPETFRDPKTKGKEQFGNTRIDVHADISGSILAPATGVYEFFAQTPNGVRVTLNHDEIIDGSVRSKSEPELRGMATLVGGRVYSLRVTASRTTEEDLPLALAWKPPGGVKEVIPQRYLAPHRAPEILVTSTSFPPDDRSVGYVRGVSVSREWDEAVTNAALEVVEETLKDLPRLTDADGPDPTAEEAEAFCQRFADQAFRRPLSEEEAERFVHQRFANPQGDHSLPVATSVSLSLLSILKSPQFLYPELGSFNASTSRKRAARLALYLRDGLPGPTLRRAAEAEALEEESKLRKHAQRMLGDIRVRSKLNRFFHEWLKLDEAGELSRDPELYPDFNQRIVADMRTSLERLLEEIVWRGDGDLRKLFLTEDLFVNRSLAEFLGIEADFADDARDDDFVKASRDTRERAGVITHPLLVAAFSYYDETSPIHRGVFLARNMLGRSLKPPPEAVAPLAPELAPGLSVRQRVTLQTSPGQCQACHVLINNLGFTLEHFDAVGRFRETELDKPIDPTGGYIATDGREVRLDGSRDLARFLADSPDMHRSFVKQLFRYLTKQPIEAYGSEFEAALVRDFVASGYNIRWLLAEAATRAALFD